MFCIPVSDNSGQPQQHTPSANVVNDARRQTLSFSFEKKHTNNIIVFGMFLPIYLQVVSEPLFLSKQFVVLHLPTGPLSIL